MTYEEFTRKFNIQLNDQQAAAVQADGPTALIAVPGSGKTTTLVARLGYMIFCKGYKPENLLTITYTTAATADMRARFSRTFGAAAGARIPFKTINALALEVVNFYASNVSGNAPFPLATSKDIADICLAILREASSEFITEGQVQELETAISYIKNMQLTREEMDEEKLSFTVEKTLSEIYDAYVNAMRRRRLMDYDDQLVYAYTILIKYPQVRAHFMNLYSSLLVDEAQDTSLIQHRIIELLVDKKRGGIFMVGDEDQSIYGFRAAYPQALLDFKKTYPGGKILFLSENYRSTPEIVDAAASFIKANKDRHDKSMFTSRSSGPSINMESIGQRHTQYKWLVTLLEKMAIGRGKTAVLYRNNSSALPLIMELNRAGISYRSRGTDSGFFTNSTVVAALNFMRQSLDPANSDLFMSTYYKTSCRVRRQLAINAVDKYTPRRYHSLWDSLLDLSDLTKHQAAAATDVRDAIIHLRNQSAADALNAIEENVFGAESFDKEKLFILKMLADKKESIEDYLFKISDLADTLAAGSEPDYDANIVLSTIHSSKGLEFDNVIIIDVIDEILPASDPWTGHVEDMEEERRLFYVAMTRAKDRLLIPQYALTPSRFVSQLTALRAAAVSGDPDLFQVGDSLLHRSFGAGTIVARRGDIISVRFDRRAIKKDLSLEVCLQLGIIEPI
ncbi:MAG: ATP-dependent helicase [Eubacterium sp.]|nr:ATP-dependent helicase [Candidatus Colimonas fimequi]